MADIAQIEVRAAVDQGIADMARAGKEVAAALKQMAAANQPVQSASKETEKSHDSLLGKMKEFQGEQRQQGRMARFYAGELMSIVPAGDAVKSKLTELVGIGVEGFAGVLSWAFAFEAAKFAVGLVVEHLGEAKKRQEEIAKAAEVHAAAIQKVATSWREYVASVQSQGLGAAAKKFTSDWREANEEVNATEVALVDIQAKAADFGRQGRSEWGFKSFWESLGFGRGSLDGEVAKAVAAVNAARVKMASVQGGYADAAPFDTRKENDAGAKLTAERMVLQAQFAGERAKAEAEYKAKLVETNRAIRDGDISQINAQAALGNVELERKNKLTEIGRKEADGLRSIQKQIDLGLATNDVDRSAIEFKYELLDIDTKLERKQIDLRTAEAERAAAALKDARVIAKERLDRAQEKGLLDAKTTPTEDAGQDLSKTADHVVAKYDAGALDRKIEKAKQNLRELMSVGQQAGATIGTAFADMVTGAASFGQGVAKVMQGVVRAVISAAIKMVEAYAVSAAGAAAFSQAGIPVIGPILAVGAIAAMGALFEGLLGKLSSAEGGFDVPSGMNPLTQLHQEEMVLPAHIANPLRQALAGGGLGGATVNLTIQTLNGRDAYRALKDNETQVMRFFREAVAGGR